MGTDFLKSSSNLKFIRTDWTVDDTEDWLTDWLTFSCENGIVVTYVLSPYISEIILKFL